MLGPWIPLYLWDFKLFWIVQALYQSCQLCWWLVLILNGLLCHKTCCVVHYSSYLYSLLIVEHSFIHSSIHPCLAVGFIIILSLLIGEHTFIHSCVYPFMSTFIHPSINSFILFKAEKGVRLPYIINQTNIQNSNIHSFIHSSIHLQSAHWGKASFLWYLWEVLLRRVLLQPAQEDPRRHAYLVEQGWQMAGSNFQFFSWDRRESIYYVTPF